MQAVQQGGEAGLLGHGGIPLGTGGAQAAARRAGVVNFVALLSGALWVDAQAYALTRGLGGRTEFCQLAGRVEDDVVCILEQLIKLIGPVGGAENMVFFFRKLLFAQAALVQAAGFGARQIGGQNGVAAEIGERFLCQQNLASRPLLDVQQNFAVAAEPGLIQQVAGGGQGSQQGIQLFAVQARKGRTGVGAAHQSTRAGAWLSERGRPYLSRASRYGSGSNSSTVCAPLVVHLPVNSISAPHMAGTPVV